MRQRCAANVSPAGPFGMLFICQGNEAAYVRLLLSLFQRYLERLTEEKGFHWMSLCCSEPAYDKFDLVRDAVRCWCDLNYERRQRMTMRDRPLVGWHNLQMIAIPPREGHVFCRVIHDL